MTTITIALPYPPSANRIWRNVGGRVLLSAEGRAYRTAVAESVAQAGVAGIYGPQHHLAVDLRVMPPDRRRRDLDNVRKALYDALTHAGVWPDDWQVRKDSAEFVGPTKGGAVIVRVEAIGNDDLLEAA